MEWTDEMIERLRALWAEGLSHAAIGSRMNISKGAVAGKAHRLELPDRECPLPKRQPGQPPKAKHETARVRTEGLRVPQGAQSLQVDTLAAFGAALPVLQQPEPEVPPVAPPPVPARPTIQTLTTIFRVGRAGQCQWPLGNGKPWRFCHAATTPGRSYCGEHAALAYVKFKAFVAIDPSALRATAAEMLIPGAKTEPLSKILAEVNRRRSSRGQSEFFLPGMSEPAAAASAGAAF